MPKFMNQMMRRIVPAILILLQLAQGMVFPHTHAATNALESIDHAERPHFHFGHCHDHGHGHPYHHHDHDEDQPPSQEPLPDSQDPLTDHDRDAVYLPDHAVACRTTPRLNVELCLELSFPAGMVVAVISAPREVTPHRSLPPPFYRQFSCPIFLQTLALLI